MRKEKTAFEWMEAVHVEFKSETDRAAGIVAGAMLDVALRDLLAGRLLSPLTKENSLIDGSRSPLGTFSSRIDAAHQLGSISEKMARDLHLIRKIRNDFSHHAERCTFARDSISSRVSELTRQTFMFRDEPELRARLGPIDARHDFLSIVSWILYSLRQKCARQTAPRPAPEEFGYRDFTALEKELEEVVEREGQELEGPPGNEKLGDASI